MLTTVYKTLIILRYIAEDILRFIVNVGAALLCARSTTWAQSPATTNAAVSAHIAHVQMAVAARDLPRGTVLTAADIQYTTATPSRDASATNATNATVAPGWVARRAIRAGETLQTPGVGQREIIVTGDAVDVVYDRDGIIIKLRGVAIGHGAMGEQISVKLDNRKRLRGIVAGPGMVTIVP